MRVPARLGWPVFFAVCASGYVLFAVLATRLDPNARPMWTIDRAAAFEAVRAFAAEQGAEVSPAEGWWSRWQSERVRGESHEEEVGRYLKAHPGTAEDLMRRLVPGLRAHAQLRTPAGELFEVWLGPDGRRVGFRRRLPEEPPPTEVPDDAADAGAGSGADGTAEEERAREIALASLLGRLESSDAVRFQLQDAEEDRSHPGPPVYTTTWEGRSEELPELAVEAVVAVRDGVVLRQELSLELDRDESGLWQALAGLAVLVLVLLALAHTTLRLVRRAREGEVSRSRGLVLGGAVLVLTAVRPWLEDGGLGLVLAVVNALGNVFNGVLQALLLAFVWIALEGDVREALPGKLTAFDTLLSGRLLSRDVAWSSLVGVALAGPALAFIQSTRLLPGTGSGTVGELAGLISASHPLLALYARLGVLWLGVLLFLPLSVLLRWNRSPRRALVQLALVLPAFTLIVNFLDSDVDAGEVAYRVVTAVFVVVPFLLRDLLAALWTTYVVAAAPRVLYLVCQPSATLRSDGLEAAAVAVLGLAGMIAVAAWGRSYSAEEVRPVYARNLAERLELLAEKKLADEAYDRLLPSTVPEVPGFALAAAAHRGKAGGSKLYDLLELPDGRLGIALIDLEGHGAAAALRLALLKGLLRTCSQRNPSPRAVLGALRARLQAPDGPAAVRFAGLYAFTEPSSRTLCFSRCGEGPALLLRRSGGEILALTGADGEDTEVVLELGDALIFASGDGFGRADSKGLRPLAGALSGVEEAGAATVRAAVRQLTAAADGEGDQTLVVLAAARTEECSA